MTTTASARSQKPRFTTGQQVRVDPAYAHEYPRRVRDGAVGEVTIVGRRARGERRYDVYFPDERASATGLTPVTVRIPEERLQAVTPPVQEPTPAAPRFPVGQRVTIVANLGGLYAAQIGVTGVISQQRQKRRLGYYWYDVTYPSVGKPSERIVIVREDDLELAPEVVEPEAPSVQPAASEPRFALGQRVMLDRLSDAAYERVARKGAVGVIVGIGKPVRGIRRYDVQYPGEAQTARERQRNPLGTLPIVHIREEHLLPVIADVAGKGVGLRSVTPVYVRRATQGVALQAHDDGTVTLRERRRHTTQYPGRAYCAAAPAGDHGWQAWDDRYRRCRFCGDVERLPGERQEREATR